MNLAISLAFTTIDYENLLRESPVLVSRLRR
jgi:hypothetical protein